MHYSAIRVICRFKIYWILENIFKSEHHNVVRRSVQYAIINENSTNDVMLLAFLENPIQFLIVIYILKRPIQTLRCPGVQNVSLFNCTYTLTWLERTNHKRQVESNTFYLTFWNIGVNCFGYKLFFYFVQTSISIKRC